MQVYILHDLTWKHYDNHNCKPYKTSNHKTSDWDALKNKHRVGWPNDHFKVALHTQEKICTIKSWVCFLFPDETQPSREFWLQTKTIDNRWDHILWTWMNFWIMLFDFANGIKLVRYNNIHINYHIIRWNDL